MSVHATPASSSVPYDGCVEEDRGYGYVMSAEVARGVARRIHGGQVTRLGDPVIEHVERVADAVPAEARALAYLHDVLERADAGGEELLELGLSDDERSVLALLTRRPEEPYRAYVMDIARAEGTIGRIARTIKLADLDDHLRQRQVAAGAPCYAWAREKIAAYQRANGETVIAGSTAAQTVAEARRRRIAGD